MNAYQYENDLPESWHKEELDERQLELRDFYKDCYEEDQYFDQFEED